LCLEDFPSWGTLWFGAVDNFEQPAVVPIAVPAEMRAQMAPELEQVLDALVTSCQFFGTPMGPNAAIDAIFHTPHTQAAALAQALPSPLRGRLAIMGANAWNRQPTASEKALEHLGLSKRNCRWIDVGGKYMDLEWITRADVRDTLDLLDGLLPDEDEGWSDGLALLPDECRYLTESIVAFRSAKHDSEAPVQVVLVPGPDKVHVHLLDDAGSFVIGEEGAGKQFVVNTHIATNATARLALIVSEFEALVNDPRVLEHSLEAFLKEHGRLFFGEQVADIRSQLVLQPELQLTGTSVSSLRPDFFVRREDSPLWDIVELKLPQTRLLRGSGDHRGFAATVTRAVDQLRAYYDYFQDDTNRQSFRDKHGLQVYQPNLCLVMGRSREFRTPQERRRLQRELIVAGWPVSLATYDDLLHIGQSRTFFASTHGDQLSS
jgi:hypothetical protein